MRRGAITVALAVVVVVVGLLAWRQWHLIPQMREIVLAGLTDPDSAKFRNESIKWKNLRPVALCGEVNTKNRMGGYVGYKKFAVTGEGGKLLAANFDDGSMFVVDNGSIKTFGPADGLSFVSELCK
jgi:hypothetical protein